jgi:hypothetical protein
LTQGASVAASSLFSVSDADGNPITKYTFNDATAGSGRFYLNGVALGELSNVELTAAQLAQTTFEVGAGSDLLWVRASDGVEWGGWKSFSVTGTTAIQTWDDDDDGSDHLFGEIHEDPHVHDFPHHDPDLWMI